MAPQLPLPSWLLGTARDVRSLHIDPQSTSDRLPEWLDYVRECTRLEELDITGGGGRVSPDDMTEDILAAAPVVLPTLRRLALGILLSDLRWLSRLFFDNMQELKFAVAFARGEVEGLEHAFGSSGLHQLRHLEVDFHTGADLTLALERMPRLTTLSWRLRTDRPPAPMPTWKAVVETLNPSANGLLLPTLTTLALSIESRGPPDIIQSIYKVLDRRRTRDIPVCQLRLELRALHEVKHKHEIKLTHKVERNMRRMGYTMQEMCDTPWESVSSTFVVNDKCTRAGCTVCNV
jgi:hypothetical protein